MVLSIAIVGAGPSGFYTALKLAQKGVKVDIFEKLQFPYGLARYGIAPFNTEAKNCINDFKAFKSQPNIRLYGNVEIGKDLSLMQLKQFYNGIVIASGAEIKKKLNIPGEEHAISSFEFTRWYNKHPHLFKSDFKVGKQVGIIGSGNVAMDISKMLLMPESLKETDVNEKALETINTTTVEDVYIFGRKSCLHTKITALELRPLTFKKVNLRVVHSEIRNLKNWHSQCKRKVKRVYEILARINDNRIQYMSKSPNRTLHFKFFAKPTAITKIGTKFEIKFEEQKFVHRVGDIIDNTKIVPTGRHYTQLFDTIITAIGNRSFFFDGFENNEKLIGFALDSSNRIYNSGWNRSGGIGVIVDVVEEAKTLTEILLRCHAVRTFKCNVEERESTLSKLDAITKDKWADIEKNESKYGIKLGKRFKFGDYEEYQTIANK